MATVLGGGLKGFVRYENGQVVQSRSMDNLLRILDRFPESLAVLPGVVRRQPFALADLPLNQRRNYVITT